jgi:hypothetical protein
MTTENYYQGVKEILHLNLDNVIRCEECNTLYDNFEENVNHYISVHNYKLLYAGQETSHRDEGLSHTPFVLLGK